MPRGDEDECPKIRTKMMKFQLSQKKNDKNITSLLRNTSLVEDYTNFLYETSVEPAIFKVSEQFLNIFFKYRITDKGKHSLMDENK